MTAQVVDIRRKQAQAKSTKLICSSCGVSVAAACSCGTAYTPAGVRAARAVAANPGKSDRAHAAELGVGSNTVRRARKATAPSGAVEKRVGQDGKVRKMPKRRRPMFLTSNKDVMPTEEEAEKSYQETLYDQACLFLESMTDKTRQKYFAFIRRTYHDYNNK
jgi:hypothetical protein